MLLTAAACQKPDDITFATLISEFEPTIAAITRLRESNRKDIAWSNHLAALSDGAPTLGWVAMVLFPSGCVLHGAHDLPHSPLQDLILSDSRMA